MALLATSANATNYGNPLQGSSAVSNSLAIQGQVQNNAPNVHSTSNGGTSTSNSGGNSINVQGDDAKRIPVSTAIAPSVSSFVKCPIATQESKAFSMLIFSASGTTGVSFHGLCYAIERGDWETADAMMCESDRSYAKSNKNCKK